MSNQEEILEIAGDMTDAELSAKVLEVWEAFHATQMAGEPKVTLYRAYKDWAWAYDKRIQESQANIKRAAVLAMPVGEFIKQTSFSMLSTMRDMVLEHDWSDDELSAVLYQILDDELGVRSAKQAQTDAALKALGIKRSGWC